MALQLNLVLASEDMSLIYVIEWEKKNRDGMNMTIHLYGIILYIHQPQDNTYFDDTTMEAIPTSEPPVNQSFPNSKYTY